MTANTPRTRKAKGRGFQDFVHAEILTAFPELTEHDVKKSIMGECGIDIKLSTHARKIFPYAVECKNMEKINIWATIKQCEENAIKEHLTPLIVFKRNRAEPHVVLKWEDFLKLVSQK
jgi:hypothetical protein